MSKSSWIVAIVILIVFIKLFSHTPSPSTTTTNDYNSIEPKVNSYNYHENSKASALVPKDYYIKPKKLIAQTYPNLKKAIMGGVLKPYTRNTYDCSEMSAYTEWKLENLGFNSKICTADNFRGSDVGHAWIMVDLERTRPCYIETTSMSNTVGVPYGTIIRGNDKDKEQYENYSRYDNIYDNIYEVIVDRSISDYDWWNSANFGKEASRLEAKIRQ